jgi:hypothetical protein
LRLSAAGLVVRGSSKCLGPIADVNVTPAFTLAALLVGAHLALHWPFAIRVEAAIVWRVSAISPAWGRATSLLKMPFVSVFVVGPRAASEANYVSARLPHPPAHDLDTAARIVSFGGPALPRR